MWPGAVCLTSLNLSSHVKIKLLPTLLGLLSELSKSICTILNKQLLLRLEWLYPCVIVLTEVFYFLYFDALISGSTHSRGCWFLETEDLYWACTFHMQINQRRAFFLGLSHPWSLSAYLRHPRARDQTTRDSSYTPAPTKSRKLTNPIGTQ